MLVARPQGAQTSDESGCLFQRNILTILSAAKLVFFSAFVIVIVNWLLMLNLNLVVTRIINDTSEDVLPSFKL